ncbi:class I adenylate-forming enzyme family protein [Streptomyces sp. AJS327]|uniref:class I adenylate-forming enzyme family protein n=1 Tax=Streptomyces sp. AJS327 TaxID=2545265 RepID=UPI0015DEA2E4|nr:class I adenylate-forming enzyme family protein [Streptomyces sp. AJS327]
MTAGGPDAPEGTFADGIARAAAFARAAGGGGAGAAGAGAEGPTTGPELAALLDARLAGWGEAPLVVDGTGTWSARQVRERIDAKAAAIRAAGLEPGAVVGLLAGPPAEFVSDLFAVLAVGGVVAPLAVGVTDWELGRIGSLAPLAGVVVGRDSALTLGPVRGVVGDRELRAPVAGPGGVPTTGPLPPEVASAQVTSGTTGRPRMALRSAAALFVEAENYRTALGLRPEVTLGCPVPLHHAYGFGLCALAAPLAGAPVRYLPADRPRVLLRELGSGAVRLFVGVPPALRMLAKAAREPLGGEPVGFLSAGMPLDAHTAESVAGTLNGHIGQVYGTTETGPICVRAPRPWSAETRWPGEPLPGVKVTLREVQAEGAQFGFGTGLVTVESPSMMLGYADGGGAGGGDTEPGSGAGSGTAPWEPVRGGFATGDLGRWEEGGLVLAGRLSTCVNVAGVKVSPEEVEAVLLAFPAVAACLVTGVDDPVLGQRVRATVTPETVDLGALERFCRERLSATHLPHHFTAVNSLPTTETGKVIRNPSGQ